jgi:hypothetical protein
MALMFRTGGAGQLEWPLSRIPVWTAMMVCTVAGPVSCERYRREHRYCAGQNE